MGILGVRLNVDKNEKELAKRLGMRFDWESKTWYLPMQNQYNAPNVPLRAIAKWLPRQMLMPSIGVKRQDSVLEEKYFGIRLCLDSGEQKLAEEQGIYLEDYLCWSKKEKTWYLPIGYDTFKLKEVVSWLPKTDLIYENHGFERIYIPARKNYKCEHCGKKMDILTSFEWEPQNRNSRYIQSFQEVFFDTYTKIISYVEFANKIGYRMCCSAKRNKYVHPEENYREENPTPAPICPKCHWIQDNIYYYVDKEQKLKIKCIYCAVYDIKNNKWLLEKK